MDLTTLYRGTKLYSIADDRSQRSASPEMTADVAVLYEHPSGAELPEDLTTFVGKVIEAGMKLDPASVICANLSYTDLTPQKLAEQCGVKTLVIFGTDWMNGLHNAQLQKNQVIRLFGIKVMITDDLETIRTNDLAKKAFWSELKKIFS